MVSDRSAKRVSASHRLTRTAASGGERAARGASESQSVEDLGDDSGGKGRFFAKTLRNFRFPKPNEEGVACASRSTLHCYGDTAAGRATRILISLIFFQVAIGLTGWIVGPQFLPPGASSLGSNAFFSRMVPRPDGETTRPPAYAPVFASGGGKPRLRPQDIAVLVLASGRRPDTLRRCLESLFNSDGLDRASVLLAQASTKSHGTVALQDEFGVASVALGEGESWNAHCLRSLKYAASKHFVGKRFELLLVLEEDQIVSPDILGFFVQAEVALTNDKSLWCISAWHDNGLSPYINDPTNVMRTDWFSGIAWLTHLGLLRSEIIPSLPSQVSDGQDWFGALRSLRGPDGTGQQCLMPEVPRAALSAPDCGAQIGCNEVASEARRISTLTVMSAAKVVNIGDVARLGKDRYRKMFTHEWPFRQGLMYARTVSSVTQLETELGYIPYELTKLYASGKLDPEVAAAREPLRLIIQHKEEGVEAGTNNNVHDTWPAVAAYFGLSRGRMLGGYMGVVRLWWRGHTLFLVSESSAFLQELSPDIRVPGSAFFARLADTRELPPRPISPGGRIEAAAPGESCSGFCEAHGEECLDADIAVVASCGMHFSTAFDCASGCIGTGSGRGYPGFNVDNKLCIARVASELTPGAKQDDNSYGIVSTCEVATPRVRRLCVCRAKLLGTSLGLQSLGEQISMEHMARLIEQKPRPHLHVNINRFGQIPAEGGLSELPIGFTESIGSLAIVVVVAAIDRSVSGDFAELRATLASLKATKGFSSSRVLVVHDDSSSSSSDIITRNFGFTEFQLLSRESISSDTRSSRLMAAALQRAVETNFASAKFIVVIEEGVRFGPDALWFFAQLVPAMERDPSLWCISAWNDQGLAPYAADPTVITRTDWFPGVAWLSSAEVLRSMLGRLGSDWLGAFRDPATRRGRQCLIPEISRVVRSKYVLFKSMSKAMLADADGRLGFAGGTDGILLSTESYTDLGDVSRLTESKYYELFLTSWPGEGLQNAVQLPSLRALLETKTGGPWSLVLDSSDAQTRESVWKAVAGFFGLDSSLPVHGSYHGVLRLRWKDSVLYLVESTSPLYSALSSSVLLKPESFYGIQRPILLPATGKLLAASTEDTSCTSVCKEKNMVCFSKDLHFVNTCEALESAFQCADCEASEGVDQPALSGKICLYNANMRFYPPSCDAHHFRTRRLCVCRTSRFAGVPASREDDAATSANLGLPIAELKTEAEAMFSSSASSVANRITTRPKAKLKKTSAQRPKPKKPQPIPGPAFASLVSTQPSDLAILVIASSHRHVYLRSFLGSLESAVGFDPHRVLVSLDGSSAKVQAVTREFGVAYREHHNDQRGAFLTFSERVASHHRTAIEYALGSVFNGSRSLLVIEEDVEVTPDFLWFFAQLEPLLHEDEKVFCISAWNELGLAPYVADPIALQRTDVFSGIAWLASASLFQNEILPKWPKIDYDKFLRSETLSSGRHCIVPELPRVRHLGSSSSEYIPPVDAARRDLGMAFARSVVSPPVIYDFGLDVVQRYHNEEYLKRFIGELVSAKAISSVGELPSPVEDPNLTANVGSLAFVLHFDVDAYDTLAQYFQLPRYVPIRGSYGGLIRLRWGSGVLFLVSAGAPLFAKVLASRPLGAKHFSLKRESFFGVNQVVLLPPDGMLVSSEFGEVGVSCQALCQKNQLDCLDADLLFINSCGALRKFFACDDCEASRGSDQPAMVIHSSNSNNGKCLFNDDLLKYPPSCVATHSDTRRLCVCRHPLGLSYASNTVARDSFLPSALIVEPDVGDERVVSSTSVAEYGTTPEAAIAPLFLSGGSTSPTEAGLSNVASTAIANPPLAEKFDASTPAKVSVSLTTSEEALFSMIGSVEARASNSRTTTMFGNDSSAATLSEQDLVDTLSADIDTSTSLMVIRSSTSMALPTQVAPLSSNVAGDG